MKINKLLILLAPLCLTNCGGNNTPDPASAQTPLCFTCTSDEGGLLGVFRYTNESEINFNLQYSTDNHSWHDVIFVGEQFPIIFKKDETVYFRGNNQDRFNFLTGDLADLNGRCTSFIAEDGDFTIGGNVMSLLKCEGFDTLSDIPNEYCFTCLFSLNPDVSGYEEYPNNFTDASKLTLPATNLKANCYYQMFRNDNLLKIAPYLPATTLATDCYKQMFEGCQNLEKLQVAFDENAFDETYSYTEDWLNVDPEFNISRTFVWNGDETKIADRRNSNTVPSDWTIKKVATGA